MKGEVEVNGRTIHYSREPLGGGNRVGGGSVEAKSRLNKSEPHAPDSEREQDRKCIERSIKRNS